MNLAYVAHTESCALLLDDEGVCRWVVPRPHANQTMIAMAKRCMGARFLASLDPDAEGLLAHEPRVGTHLLFAISIDARVALIRVGPLLRFDTMDSTLACADPADEAMTPVEPAAATDVDPFDQSDNRYDDSRAEAAAPIPPPEESQEQLELDDDITNLFARDDETPIPRQSGFAIRGMSIGSPGEPTKSVTPVPVPPPTRRDLDFAAELQSLMEEETCPFSRVVYEWAAGQEDAASTLRLPLPGRGILPRRSSR